MNANIQGLNKLFLWSIAQLDDAPHIQPTTTVPREKLDTAVLESLFGEPDVKKMKLLVNVIKENRDKASPEQRVQALEALEDFVEQVDNANDLDKIGGVEVIVTICLKSVHGEERAAAASVIAAVARNNPTGQKNVVDRGGLSGLAELLRTDTDTAVLCKVVSALSALLQHNPVVLQRFAQLGGLAVLGNVLTNPRIHVRCKDRITFFLSVMMHDPEELELLVSTGLVDLLLTAALAVGEQSVNVLENTVKGLHNYHRIDPAGLKKKHGQGVALLGKLVEQSEDPETKQRYNDMITGKRVYAESSDAAFSNVCNADNEVPLLMSSK